METLYNKNNIYLEERIINKHECEVARAIASKELWMTFFNDYLFNQGVITEEEKLKMNGKITSYISRMNKSRRS